MSDDNNGPSAEEINAAKNATDELAASMKEYKDLLTESKDLQELLAKIAAERLKTQELIVKKEKEENDLLTQDNSILNDRVKKRLEEKEIQQELWKQEKYL